jgi:myosin heavy subunit
MENTHKSFSIASIVNVTDTTIHPATGPRPQEVFGSRTHQLLPSPMQHVDSSLQFSSTATSKDEVITIDTPQGPRQLPADIHTASRVTDAKRARNAGASARFRSRRKANQEESSRKIEELENQTRELGEFYRWREEAMDRTIKTVQQQKGELEHKAKNLEQDRDFYRWKKDEEREFAKNLRHEKEELEHMVKKLECKQDFLQRTLDLALLEGGIERRQAIRDLWFGDKLENTGELENTGKLESMIESLEKERTSPQQDNATIRQAWQQDRGEIVPLIPTLHLSNSSHHEPRPYSRVPPKILPPQTYLLLSPQPASCCASNMSTSSKTQYPAAY